DARFEVDAADARYILCSAREAHVTDRTLLGRPTPCVGRDKELALLLALYDECTDEPAARAALVTAPAGTGKSRLCHEVLRRVRERERAPEIWIARGDPLRKGSAFAMLGDAIRGAAGLRDGEPL